MITKKTTGEVQAFIMKLVSKKTKIQSSPLMAVPVQVREKIEWTLTFITIAQLKYKRQ